MPKEEWGTKRVCPTTGKRFYDLNRDPVISPYTGEAVAIETGKKSMIAADAADKASKKKAAEKEDDDELVVEDEVDVDLDDDDVLEDEDDDDTVSLDEIADVAGDDNDDS